MEILFRLIMFPPSVPFVVPTQLSSIGMWSSHTSFPRLECEVLTYRFLDWNVKYVHSVSSIGMRRTYTAFPRLECKVLTQRFLDWNVKYLHSVSSIGM